MKLMCSRLLFLLLVFVPCVGMATPGNPVTKIGVMLALTGDIANLGTEVRRGIELASEEGDAQAQGFQLIIEDIHSLDPSAAVSAAQKLLTVDKIDVGVTMIVDEAQAIAPIFTANKTLLVILWDSNAFLRSAGEYIFSNGFSTERAGQLLAEFVHDNLKLNKLAVISHTNPWSEIITPEFVRRFEDLGGQIVYRESVSPETTDYKTVILKLKGARPEGVFLPLVPPNSLSFLKQMRELQVGLPLISGDALIQEVIDGAGPAADGIYLANIYSEESAQLAVKYKNKFKAEPLDPTLVSFGYEGFRKIASAVKLSRDGKVTVQAGLLNIFGPDRSTENLEKIFRIQSGKLVAIDETKAAS